MANLTGINSASPIVSLEEATVIRSDAILTATWVVTSILNVASAREIALYCNWDAATIGGFVQIMPLFAAKQVAAPVAGDDVWYGPLEYDGSHTAAVAGGTIFTGGDLSLTPDFARISGKQLIIRTDAADATTDEGRVLITLKCAAAGYFMAACVDTSAVATLTNLAINAVRVI